MKKYNLTPTYSFTKSVIVLRINHMIIEETLKFGYNQDTPG